MFDLLCHETTFNRISERLSAYKETIHPVFINDDGKFTSAFTGDAIDTPKPHIAYGTVDAYFAPSVMDFMVTIMGSERLDWFQSSAAGIEHPALQGIGAQARLFTRSHAQSDSIAEWVIWAGLDYFQGGPERRAAQAEKDWKRMPFREIAGTHWVIVGFGEIGRASARRLRTMGASVTGVRRTPGTDPDADVIAHPSDLPSLLPTADAVLLCAPHTPDTENMADAEFFAAMKENALLMNVGRGALVDEPALLAGLAAGKPAYAALDVVVEEPLPEDNPIWSHNKITLTPHTSALTEGAKRRTDEIFLANLNAYLTAGGKPDVSGLKHYVPKSEFENA